MSSSNSNSNRGEDDDQELKARERSKTLKEGERILAPTRRPDGTLRKPVRIRAGYVPQEEVAIYQPKPALVTPLYLYLYIFSTFNFLVQYCIAQKIYSYHYNVALCSLLVPFESDYDDAVEKRDDLTHWTSRL